VPGFVAAAVGYEIFVGFGDWGDLDAPGLAVPHLALYNRTRVLDLLVAVAVGVVAAMLIAAIHRFTTEVALERARRMGLAAALLGGGLLVGALALLADGLGADSQDVLFSGQAPIEPLVEESSTCIVLVLLVARRWPTPSVSPAASAEGRSFQRSSSGSAWRPFRSSGFDVSPTFAIAVGAAAGMAAHGRLILTSMLFAALLVGTQGFDAIPGAVLAAVAAWITGSALDRRRVAAPAAQAHGPASAQG
jgi:hypothetical protein